jgi:hypothetical protein
LAHGGSTIPPWCRHRVGTVESFHNIDISRCLDAKTSCRIKGVRYSLTNNCYCRHNYYGLFGFGGRTIIIAVAARAQGSTTKSQLRRNNDTDEKRFGCYANGRRAHVQGSTTPGARHARPSGYLRLPEEASVLPAGRGAEQ